MVALLATSAGSLDAQLISNPQQIPDTGKPPVVFVNGYQNGCRDQSSFSGTFGIADQLLQSDNRVSLFFDNCTYAKNASIEDIGNALRDYLNGLRYTDGRTVPQVDVVAHSMGGDIVRSYLSGKQTTRGVFNAPPSVRIRKAVLIAIPFFGSYVADLAPVDVQSQELQPGSAFLFDLATWNQGRDDLRGIDAVGVVAIGGTGIVSGKRGFDDSTVTVTSASLEFALKDRTRVIPDYCHTALSFPLSLACVNPDAAIARMTSDQHITGRIMISFLNSTTDWMSFGTSPAADNNLGQFGGLEFQLRDAQDQIVRVNSSSNNLKVRSNEVVWGDAVAPQKPFQATLTLASGSTTISIDQTTAGSTQSFIIPTAGPIVTGIIPNFGDVSPRAMAPGSFFSVYGSSLAASPAAAPGGAQYPTTLGGVEVRINDQPIQLQYVSPTQINAIVPDNATGAPRIVVRSPSGQRGLNILIEPAVPSLFDGALNAQTNQLLSSTSPAHAGDYVALYGTGLGLTEQHEDGLNWAVIQPRVQVGGQPCQVVFAGRAPGFAGLDQINCQIATNASVADRTEVIVSSGTRSATIHIPVR